MPDNVGLPRHRSCERSCESSDGLPEAEQFGDHIEASLDEVSGKWETLSNYINVDVSLFSKWVAARKNHMPAWRLVSFSNSISCNLLRRLANACGWDLVRLRGVKPCTCHYCKKATRLEVAS